MVVAIVGDSLRLRECVGWRRAYFLSNRLSARSWAFAADLRLCFQARRAR
jgi:hypothetical protein